MECALCKVGTTKKGTVNIHLERGDSIIIIKDVPAEVCSNCGHYYLDEETTRQVLDRANKAFQEDAELEVIRLRVA